jgi:hypothetical protein
MGMSVKIFQAQGTADSVQFWFFYHLGFQGDFMGFFMGFLWGFMGFNGIYDGYTLVICYAMRTGESPFF